VPVRQILYIDGEDAVIPLPKSWRQIRMGEKITLNGEQYEAWYIEECQGNINIRVEKVNGERS